MVRDTVVAVRRGLGEKLRSVLLVGTAVPPARRAGERPLELLVVTTDLPVPALSNLAHQTRAVAPPVRLRVLTERELLRAADVFTLELAEVQARHVRLTGADPFGVLHFTPEELRRSLEHGLRSLTRGLRDGVILAARELESEQGTDGAIVGILSDAVDQLARIAHHALELSGAQAPAGEVELLRALATLVGTPEGAVDRWLPMLRAGAPLEQPVDGLVELLEMAEVATGWIDAHGAAQG